ncbi:MAG: phosphate acyltransferase PlsX [Anaerolineae bacterium]|nr:phosphate acyltransferase PlsX [Anaerolineae bacterium]
MKIVLDAMGGDHAPGVVIDGAVMAAREFPGIEIILVGREEVIKRELARYDTAGLLLSITHASEIVEMEEHTDAVKIKRDSSMRVGMRLVKDGQADAFVSAGNSGGVMAAALFELGRIRGIKRPALATVYPAAPIPVLLLDMGANTDPKPEYLVQFALMGTVYVERMWGLSNPRVGIVSNGEEADKGNILVRDTYPLLQASGLNFIGNVEGKDVTKGLADVVVTDGFTGNVMVKLSEGLVSFLVKYLKAELTAGPLNKVGLLLMVPGALAMLPGLLLLTPTVRRITKRMDYAEYGGAPLLGVDGVVIIGHGRSNARAIKNAVRVAKEAVETGMVSAIKDGLQQWSANEEKGETDV